MWCGSRAVVSVCSGIPVAPPEVLPWCPSRGFPHPPVVPVVITEVPLLCFSAHNGQIRGDLFKGVFFPNGSLSLELVFFPIVDLLRACYIPIPPWILASFGGKERGDLDSHFHQSLSPLCEGNPLDIDLGVLGVLLLVLPLIFLQSFCCFGGSSPR